MASIPERKPFIAGGSRTTGQVIDLRAPHNQELVARVHRAGPSDVAAAIEAAAIGFERTRRMEAYERAAVLTKMAVEVVRRREDLARVLALEAGKPLKAARVEAERTVHTLETAAEEAKRLGGEFLPLDVVPWGSGRFGLVRRFPLGPVAGITPFNFPLNLTAHKIAPALAVGNSIVIKPASQTPSSALMLAEIASSAGAPPGAVNVVTASAADAAPLVDDDRLKMLTFTGSGAVGWELRRRAAKKRVTLELGGNAAAIVCEGADLPYAAERIVAGGYGYAGQSCISVQRVLVQERIHDRLLDLLVDKVRALHVGDPLDEETDVGPLIAESEARRAEDWIREAVSAGAEIMTGGERDGVFLEPTVLVKTRPEMKVNCLEIFAPVVTVAPFADLRSAIRMVNESRYGLQAGIFTPEGESAWEAFESIEVGGVIINDVPTYRVDHMPYGGVKESGTGREGLRYAIEEMTEPRLMVWTRRG